MISHVEGVPHEWHHWSGTQSCYMSSLMAKHGWQKKKKHQRESILTIAPNSQDSPLFL